MNISQSFSPSPVLRRSSATRGEGEGKGALSGEEMSNIYALLNNSPVASEDVVAVQRMKDAQTHRGPDGAGSYNERPVGLGQRSR